MPDPARQLSRRERQIMDIIYSRERASANDVLGALPDPPSRTAVRTLLSILEQKGHLKHDKVGREFVYSPTRQRRRAGRSAFRNVLKTFYSGSLEQAVAAHLADLNSKLSAGELKQLSQLIRQTKKREQ